MTSEAYNCHQVPLPLFCPRDNSRNSLSKLIVCINEEPTPFCERVFFVSGCFCFISIGENDIISVHGRKDIVVRTVEKEEEKELDSGYIKSRYVVWGRRGPGNSCVVLPGLLWTGTHVSSGRSQDNRDLLFGWGGGCRIPTEKLLLCLFIIQGLGSPATHTSKT